MRRRQDSWLNATQILKVAGVEKGRRTKILEKDIAQSGIKFEKVQGGYGRYQGTWISFHDGQTLAEEYGVLALIQPLLEYQAAPGPPPLAGLENRNRSNSSATNNNNNPNIDPALTSPSTELSPPLPTNGRPTALSPAVLENDKAKNSRKRTRQGESAGAGTMEAETERSSRAASKRARISPLPPPADGVALTAQTGGPPAASDRSLRKANVPLDPETLNQDHRTLLMNLFLTDPSDTFDPSSLISSFPPDLNPDTPIDDQLHTALHWASALARISTVTALVGLGADPARGNSSGETPLMRAVLVTNNFDTDTFAPPNGILAYLGSSLRTTDDIDRTVLHHLALVSGIRGRSASARHYMESILHTLVETEDKESIAAYLDAQDAHGDTAINIAARVGSRPMVRMLLENGANGRTPNKLGLRPGDFGILEEGLSLPTPEEEAVEDLVQSTSGSSSKKAGTALPSSSEQSATVLSKLTTLLTSLSTDFSTELQTRSDSLGRTRAQLRTATKELAEQRQNILALKEKVRRVEESKWRIRNLEKALEEEERFDWTGRTGVTGQPAFPSKSLNSAISDKADGTEPSSSEDAAVARAAFEYRGSTSTLGALPAVNMPNSIEADPTPPPSTSSTLLSLSQYRRMVIWYERVLALLSDRIQNITESNASMELDCRKVVRLCIGAEREDEVDGVLDNLISALESDTTEYRPGSAGAGGLDLQRCVLSSISLLA